MDLQNTFYVLGIIIMSITLILLIVIVVAVLVIRAKINAIHHMIEEKIELLTNPAAAASKLVKGVQQVVRSKR
jgi:septation ring formation regulator EzrA